MTSRTLSEIADLCGATITGDSGDSTLRVVGPAPLRDAGPEHVAFYDNPRYQDDLMATRAAAVLVTKEFEPPREGPLWLHCDDPSRAFTDVIRAFVADDAQQEAGVHPTACVDPSAEIASDACIGPLCVVAAGARIGAGVRLVAQVHIGARARIGDGSLVYPNAVFYHDVEVGARCVIHAGVVLGADGFGFEPTANGWEKIPQVGTVVVGDDVEIGANTTVDRARFGVTRIDTGAKLDNLIHVGHNCEVGASSAIAAQVGIAGSSRVGAGSLLAGQVGVSGHAEIGPGARIGGQAGVMSFLEGGKEYIGSPALPLGDMMRFWALRKRLPDLFRRVREIERRLPQEPS